MDSTQTTSIIITTLSTYGSAVLIILGVVLGIGIAYIIYCFGWFSIKNSLSSNTHYRLTENGKPVNIRRINYSKGRKFGQKKFY